MEENEIKQKNSSIMESPRKTPRHFLFLIIMEQVIQITYPAGNNLKLR